MAMTKDQRRDAELADWADALEVSPEDPYLLRGQAAQVAGRELLAAVGRGGRPLDPAMTKGEHSPRRQVRLPKDLSDAVDQLASTQRRQPSAVMREAIARYVSAELG